MPVASGCGAVREPPLRGEGTKGREERGRGWKVPDGCAGRRLRLYRCVLVRHSGCSTSMPTLRQPQTSERMWRRREGISVWGSLDHQKCPTIRRYGGVDSLPSPGGIASPRATTVESLGTMALGSSMTPCSMGVAREGEGVAPGECSVHLALALGKGMPVLVQGPSIAGHVDREGQ